MNLAVFWTLIVQKNSSAENDFARRVHALTDFLTPMPCIIACPKETRLKLKIRFVFKAIYVKSKKFSQAVKFCHRNFKIFNGVDLVGSIQLECNPEDKTLSWRTSTGQEDPPCLELCSNSTKCSNPDQTCQKGACMSTKCDEEIPNGQIEAKGSNGVLVCRYHLLLLMESNTS